MSHSTAPGGTTGNFARTFFIGGAIVATCLGGFYMHMLNRKHKETIAGKNPHHEQIAFHVSKQHGDLTPLRSSVRDSPVPVPLKEHNSGHSTIANFKASPGYTDTGRYMVPPPQRAKDDGSGRAYTKSPDYVKNYEKTYKLPKPQA